MTLVGFCYFSRPEFDRDKILDMSRGIERGMGHWETYD